MSSKYHVNPDNVATPIAASLGDLVTLAILAFTSHVVLLSMRSVLVAVLAIYLTLLPGLYRVAGRSELTRSVASDGWVPILSA